MLTDTRLASDELQRIANELRDNWHTGRQVDFEEAIAFHESLPRSKEFATVLESADAPLLQPRAGVPCLEEQIELRYDISRTRAAPTCCRPPSTRTRATTSTRRPKRAGSLAQQPGQRAQRLPRGQPRRRGLSATRPGARRTHRGPPRYPRRAPTGDGDAGRRLPELRGRAHLVQHPLHQGHSLAETIEHWQFVDRLCGAYTERGVTINREPFGPLTGTLVPPSIAITVMLIEGLLAATQGVRSLTLGYGQVGNLVQDVAALRALRSPR